jgi:transposase
MSSTIDLFNLPTYRLTRAEQDDHDVHLYAEVCTPASACIHCHEVSLEGFGRRERHIKDLPMQGNHLASSTDGNVGAGSERTIAKGSTST